jgi:hypothetical protein
VLTANEINAIMALKFRIDHRSAFVLRCKGFQTHPIGYPGFPFIRLRGFSRRAPFGQLSSLKSSPTRIEPPEFFSSDLSQASNPRIRGMIETSVAVVEKKA